MANSSANTVADAQEALIELTVDEAVSVAVQLHQRGFLEEAQTVYERTLAMAPEHPDALHFFGVLMHQLKHGEEAVALIRKSIALAPANADAHNNLGNVLLEQERAADAIEAYRQAIALRPGFAPAYNNLGAVLRTEGRFAEAATAYEKAIALDPERADAYHNMGNLLSSQRRTIEAVAYYCKAITLTPGHPESNRMLGIAYYTLGRVDEAAQVFRRWLDQEPDNPVAKHLYAACSGKEVPVRAADAYVEATFDGFADSFDAKLGKLAYRAPQLVAEALARAAGSPAGELVALDAGCGTGLCGPLIAAYVSHLTGVDLSERMLAKAREKAVYDALSKAELTAFLVQHPAAFDLVISADTLCYFGELGEVLRAAYGALRDHGLLIFTVEQARDSERAYHLNPNGRYSHGQACLEQALAGAGFAKIDSLATHLRNEGGEPVAGLVLTARRGLY